ncbi:Fur family transcriptional regulator [Aequorivita capsosiphonis]|uniref:Fur family transcriptional regulator n=1 Tax=Aequorivita capsosiphonis TaxID=487317 RepID=UPI0005554A45|nr:transcriptional repressor [Aequorivita capsosiphonis]
MKTKTIEKPQLSNIEPLLQKSNIRPTAMRILVYKFLLENEAAKALIDIENHFAKSDRTTLYRTIKTFEDKGIVHQIDDGTGTAKYALCEEGCNCEIETDLHLHFHCKICDETICLTDHKIPQINLPNGFSAENANLVIKGICDKCSC